MPYLGRLRRKSRQVLPIPLFGAELEVIQRRASCRKNQPSDSYLQHNGIMKTIELCPIPMTDARGSKGRPSESRACKTSNFHFRSILARREPGRDSSIFIAGPSALNPTPNPLTPAPIHENRPRFPCSKRLAMGLGRWDAAELLSPCS